MPCAADGNTQQETADRVTTALITQMNLTEPVTEFKQSDQTKVCFIHLKVHRINKVVHPKKIISTYE